MSENDIPVSETERNDSDMFWSDPRHEPANARSHVSKLRTAPSSTQADAPKGYQGWHF